ncbi:30S ribosomal protein S20 [Zhongshania aliphaticivorans]|uniref:Small ribosomal subunit protein bS20 n=1 Tax=Zhongshania aliphaticivorans TaxID=1470434 RepID=A0A5S9Q421_9GAMM|nr:30S ribosomal protein S20 [Zhongshania aliphaticivorans]CAA0111709.1 30S ribosomal protein S20 [Zhongshania aliphaticivorans]CAA0118778.1 30S ribosomal protein S20 [Zhongshania aliphaticivorans]
MANSPQAKKRARQAEKRRTHNASLRSMVRTYLKKVVSAIESGDQAEAQTAYVAAVPVLDRMADKGIVTKNKAARHKSRLNSKIKAMATAA